MSLKHLAITVGFCVAASPLIVSATAQTATSAGLVIPLYAAGTIPSLGTPEIREPDHQNDDILIRNVSDPSLELFRPPPGQSNGTAVIIAPGGGFVVLGYKISGIEVARALAQHGVTAFVLKYRTIKTVVGSMEMPAVHMKEMAMIMARAQTGLPMELPRFAGEAHAVEDGERAMDIVRHRAADWGVNPHRVGVIGFSAGAYLAADLAIGNPASRPDFVGLIYGGLRTPVVHDASPAFIAGAADDAYQPNDPVLLYNAWHQAGVVAELHVYERGGHGFGLRAKGTTSDHWFDELVWWMQARGLIRPQPLSPGSSTGPAGPR